LTFNEGLNGGGPPDFPRRRLHPPGPIGLKSISNSMRRPAKAKEKPGRANRRV
jgi:hypothetical protein